uniref:B30.2/SPRY domain-containing protein n=1 Tax=Globodera pallida TaxID=36090 RepID=A0A183CEL0_GLOPA
MDDKLLLDTKDEVAYETIYGTWRSVRAERPIPNGNLGFFYYEVKILVEKDVGIHIGLTGEQMPLYKWVGCCEGTYAYEDDGTFWGHAAVDGCAHLNGRPYIDEGIPEFGVGDVIGCGVDLATRQIIYTKNGRKTTGLFVDSAGVELFACVSLSDSGDKIEANFGPNFEYKF